MAGLSLTTTAGLPRRNSGAEDKRSWQEEMRRAEKEEQIKRMREETAGGEDSTTGYVPTPVSWFTERSKHTQRAVVYAVCTLELPGSRDL